MAATSSASASSNTPLQGTTALQYIIQKAQQLGLDPFAVVADAKGEGLGGGIGDNGHAFGPFQLNDAGGLFPASISGQQTSGWSTAQKQSWAWSPAGIDYALSGIAAHGAAGLKGIAALHNIVYLFENPANKAGALSTRTGYYNQLESITGGSAQKLGTLPIVAETTGGAYQISPSGPPGSSTTPFSANSGCSLTSNIDVFGIKIPYPDVGCIFSTIAAPFVTLAGQITSFFSNIVSYLQRGGLLLGGAVLIIVGFLLLGRTAVA